MVSRLPMTSPAFSGGCCSAKWYPSWVANRADPKSATCTTTQRYIIWVAIKKAGHDTPPHHARTDAHVCVPSWCTSSPGVMPHLRLADKSDQKLEYPQAKMLYRQAPSHWAGHVPSLPPALVQKPTSRRCGPDREINMSTTIKWAALAEQSA